MSVIAAFELIGTMIRVKKRPHLPLRFAYIQLIQAINAFKEAASSDRLAGRLRRKAGYSDASAAIDVYLVAKGIPPHVKRCVVLCPSIRGIHKLDYLIGQLDV
jgi:hypothetical protein